MKHNLNRANSFKRSYKKQNLTNEKELAYIDILYHLLNGLTLESNSLKEKPIHGITIDQPSTHLSL